MRAVADCIRVFFSRVLDVATSEVIESVSLLLLGFENVFGNLGLYFREIFIAFSLACTAAMYPTYLIFGIGERFTLKGF